MKLLALILVILLAGCVNPLAMLTGGKPSVAANVQVGKENTQQVVASQTKTEAGRDIIQQNTPVVAQEIKEVTIQQTPMWVLILLVLGWLLPSPNEIGRLVRGLFRK